MDMVGHDHKDKQLYPACRSDVMETIKDNPFDYVAAKEVSVPHCSGGHEVKIMGSKGWFDRHVISVLLLLGLPIHAPAGSATLRITLWEM